MEKTTSPFTANETARERLFSHAPGFALVLAVCLVLYFWGLGTVPFYDKGEPREGLVVWEIWTAGNWILPLRGGVDIPSKPPLFHWIGALASTSMGRLDEFTVRFPSALLATLGVLLTYWAGARLWGESAGLAAAAVLATSSEWWRAATTARVDMTLTFFMLCAFLYFYALYKSGGGILPALFLALLAGLATLAKGPVGAVLPGAAALLFLWLKRDLAFIKRLHLYIAIPFGAIVAGSWYLLALGQGGEKFFLRQIVHEIIMTPLGGAGHVHQIWYYVPALIFGMAPWSLFFPALAVFLYRERRRLAEEELLYPLVWFAVVFVVLSVSLGKRSVYILPLYPAAALLFGAWWGKLMKNEISSSGTVRLAAFAIAFLLLLLSAALLTQAAGGNSLQLANKFLGAKDRETAAAIAVVMGELRPAILFSSALSFLGGLALFLAARRNRWNFGLAALAIVMVVSLWQIQNQFHPAAAGSMTVKPFLARARQKVGDGRFFYYGSANPAVAFYVRMFFPRFQEDRRQPNPPFHMLIQEKDWRKLQDRQGMEEVDVGEAAAGVEDQRLILVRVTQRRPMSSRQ